MKKLSHIARYLALAILLLLLLALAPAKAQNVVHNGETSTLSVEPQPGDTYTWELYKEPANPNFNFATVPGETSPSYATFINGTNSSTVTIEWKKAGIYFYKVSALDITGCTNNIKIGMIEVLEALPTALISNPAEICAGETVSLTIDFTGTGPFDFTYTATDEGGDTTTSTVTNVTSPYQLIINPGPVTTTEYRLTSIKDKFGTNTGTPSNTVIQIVNPLPVPSTIYHR